MEAIKKKRTLFVEGMSCNECEEKIEKTLKELKGVIDVKSNHHDGRIDLEYDLTNINLEELEKRISDLGYKLDEGLFKKFKRSLIHFMEQNEADHLKTKPSSCCEPPEEKGKE